MAEAITVAQLKIGDILTCNLYGNGAINNISEGTLIGFSSGDALRDPGNAASNHANIFPTLPNNPDNPVLDDYSSYEYLVIRKTDDAIIEVGVPWLQPASLSRLDRKTATVTIGDFDDSRLTTLRNILEVNGFTKLTITVA